MVSTLLQSMHILIAGCHMQMRLQNWIFFSIGWTHINDGENILKKPVLFTEFGYPLNVKSEGISYGDTLLRTVYDSVRMCLESGASTADGLETVGACTSEVCRPS